MKDEPMAQKEESDIEVNSVEEEKKEEVESEAEETEAEPEKEDPPKVTLTDEEKALKWFPSALPDVASVTLATTFTKYTLPEKEDGYDEVRYSAGWANAGKAPTVLKEWTLQKKIATRVEDIKPSAWFNTENSKWQNAERQYHKSVNDYKAKLAAKARRKEQAIAAKAAAEKRAKEAAERKAAAEAAAAKKKEEEEAKKAEEAAKKAEEAAKKAEAGEEAKEGEEKKDEEMKEETKEEVKAEEKPAEEKAEEKEEEKAAPMEVEESEEEPDVDFDGVDIFGVEDVKDIEGGVPLSRDFQFEDWSLMAMRFELHILVHAFKKDCNDEERKGIALDHLGFYYNRYFRKTLLYKSYGVNTAQELVELVGDTVHVKDGVLCSMLPETMESFAIFLKLTEEARRHRNLQIDLGKEEAKLKIEKSAGQRGAGGEEKGKGKSKEGAWGDAGKGRDKGPQDWGAGAGASSWGAGGNKGQAGSWGMDPASMKGMMEQMAKGMGKDKSAFTKNFEAFSKGAFNA